MATMMEVPIFEKNHKIIINLLIINKKQQKQQKKQQKSQNKNHKLTKNLFFCLRGYRFYDPTHEMCDQTRTLIIQLNF